MARLPRAPSGPRRNFRGARKGHGLLGPRDVDPFQAHDNLHVCCCCCTTVLRYMCMRAYFLPTGFISILCVTLLLPTGQSAIVCVRELVCREGGAGCSLTHVHRASACTLNAVGLLPVSGRGDARVAPPCPTTLCVWRNLPYLTLPYLPVPRPGRETPIYESSWCRERVVKDVSLLLLLPRVPARSSPERAHLHLVWHRRS